MQSIEYANELAGNFLFRSHIKISLDGFFGSFKQWGQGFRLSVTSRKFHYLRN